jgi:hypothetical protein
MSRTGKDPMSSKHPVRQKSIRVNLRFGPNSDARLVRMLESLPPYARGKFVRRLVIAGARFQRGERTSAVSEKGPSLSETPRSETMTAATPDDAFAQSVAQLLGTSVK